MATHITVDDEQATLLARATGVVEIRDRQGRLLGYATHGFTADDIVLARQRLASDGPWFTTDEVLARLKSVETR